jgi:dTDP-4-amino-4,6-dideoxygalactose transaminase
MIAFFDLKRQTSSMQAEIVEAVERVLASGWFILGPEVEKFEQEFAAYIGVQHAIGVGSGTDALVIALRALGVGANVNDEVITVPNTAVATVSAIELAGARPVLVDVHPDTMLMDPTLVERAITPRTRVIIPVHLFGQAADLDPILAIAERHKLRVLEDCAQAHGATYHGRRVGGIGDVAAFSFYPTKNLGAIGDGGMVVANDADLTDRARLLRQYGWRERYQSDIKGMNTRLDELQAAILHAKLPRLEGWNAARRERAALYRQRIGDRVALPVEMSYGEHAYHLFVVRTPHRDALAAHLKSNGVGTAIQYPTPIHLQSAYRVLGTPGSFPASEQLAREILSLPIYPELPLDDVEAIARAVNAFHHAS